MSWTRRILVPSAGVLLMAIGGCASKAQPTGFLTTYSNLEPVDATSLRYLPGDNRLSGYSKFIVEPVVVRFYDSETAGKIEPEDMRHLQQYMYQAVRSSLGEVYPITSRQGPGVARLRIAITNLKKSTPALTALPETKRAGLGLGQVTVEAELVDSITGDQIAATIESETGSRFSFTGLSRWADVEAVVDGWAGRLRKRVDEAHGRTD